MRFVESPLDWQPAHCALAPSRTEGIFIDLEVNVPLVDPHLYLHIDSVREMGEMIDMVPKELLTEAEGTIAELQELLEAKEQELMEADAENEALRHLLDRETV